MNKRLLLIGGSSGSGKTTTSRLLVRRLAAGWLQVDTVWVTAQAVIPADSEVGRLLRVDRRIRDSDDSIEQMMEQQIAASQYVCSLLPRVIPGEIYAHTTLVADGAWLLPEFVHAFQLDGVDIRAAYLHEASAVEIRRTLDTRRVVQTGTLPWHERVAQLNWQYGNWLAAEAEKFGFPVVAARPRETLVDRMLAALGCDSPR